MANGKGRARCRASQDVLKEMNPLVLDGVELASNRRLATEYFAVLTRIGAIATNAFYQVHLY